MTLALFVPRASPVHRTPAGWKLLTLAGLSVLVFALPTLPVVSGALVAVLVVGLLVARLPGAVLLRQARAVLWVLVMRPARIVFDEPTTLLDLVNTRRVAQVIEELEQQVVVVTHDLDLLEGFDRVLVFDDGRVVADGPPDRSVAAYRTLMVHR